MPTPTPTSTCRSCGARIRWAQTAAGKRIPLDPTPEKRVTLDNYTGSEVAAVRDTYVSHFATCPDADVHRRSRS